MTKRQYAALQYNSPDVLLREVLPIIKSIHGGTALAKSLKAVERKAALEKYQAAYLAFIFRQGMKTMGKVSVCLHESEDFDCVFRAERPRGEVAYKPVQLKQLPCHGVNPHADIQTEINKLQKYSSRTLMIAYWINRDIRLDLQQLNFDKLNVEQIWLFGDSPKRYIMFHGGIVTDLRAGSCWAGRMENGHVSIKPWRFKKPPISEQ